MNGRGCGDTYRQLTHWGRVTHICVSKLTINGSSNGLWHGRREAIIWTSAEILLIGSLETNFSEIQTFLSTKMQLKMSSAKWRPFCLGLNVLRWYSIDYPCLVYSTNCLGIGILIIKVTDDRFYFIMEILMMAIQCRDIELTPVYWSLPRSTSMLPPWVVPSSWGIIDFIYIIW